MPSAAGPCGLQGALRQEARAAEGHALLQPGRRVFPHELHGAAAGEEGADGLHVQARDLRQQRLEVGFREGQLQLAHHLAAAGGQALAEALAGLVAGGVVPGDPGGALHALLPERQAHAVGRLPVGEGGAEDRGRAELPRRRDVAGVRDDERDAALARRLHQRHHHARMDGADQHLGPVAADQPVDVLHRVGGIRLVVEADDLQGPPAHPAAALGEVQLEGGGDVLAERREGAREGQHETDAQGLPALGEGGPGRPSAGENRGPGQGGEAPAARKDGRAGAVALHRIVSSHRAWDRRNFCDLSCRSHAARPFCNLLQPSRAPATSLGSPA